MEARDDLARTPAAILSDMSIRACHHLSLLLCALAVAMAPRATAAEPPASAAGPAAASAGVTTQAPTAAATAPAAAPAAPDLAELALQLADEQRLLQADGVEFPVFVKPARGEPAQGALLLLPGDGAYPTASPAIEQLRQLLPALGWSTWLISLESPPRSHSGRLADNPDPQPPATPAQRASDEQRRLVELQEWAKRCQARIAQAVTAASAEGSLVLVAENSAAALLTGFVGAQPAAARAAVVIEPVDFPGLASEWPKDLALPVLELLNPVTHHEQGAQRREQAKAMGLENYRQIMISIAPWQPGDNETLLAKRVRGWLKSLDQDSGSTPDAD